jgi:aspartate/tyrosine/aromatic aminotransferase
MWKNIIAAPEDSILGLTEAFKKESNPQKVNLGVGVYKDDNGNTPILHCVKAAEKILLQKENTKSYLPISGDPAYAAGVRRLLFGEKSGIISSGRAATVHAPGGTGALRVGADLLKKFKPEAKVWISTPTWANHNGIFNSAGFQLEEYPYYNHKTKKVDFELMLACLEAIPERDIVLLHACCHNPSGVDLSFEQWQKIALVGREKGWTPFLDFAYQGLGQGVEEDRLAVEQFALLGVDYFVASSFSKNFGLYNERTGALTIVCPSIEESTVAMSHLKAAVRVCYSNPPAHGGLVVSTILNDPALHQQWLEELNSMRERIVSMRAALVDGLAARGVNEDFSYIKEQRGMFSFIGISNEVVTWMREKKGIYVVAGGRINLAGLSTRNIDYVCDSIAEALA